MKFLFLICGFYMAAACISAQGRPAIPGPTEPVITWDLLWAGSWEETNILRNRGDFRLGFTPARLVARAQVLDKRTFNFELDPPWDDSANNVIGISAGLYHKMTGSRLLYGALDEWGLSARIRNPWIRSAPYAENHQPLMADLKTTASSAKAAEAYLYLSTPRLSFASAAAVPVTTRVFASAQSAVGAEAAPMFSGGLETRLGEKIELLLEGLYTSAELSARTGNAWFSEPPPLPSRNFRLGAAALALNIPYIALSSDWAWSETFAFGRGIYGNAGIRLQPPFRFDAGARPGPWSLSLAVDGMSERYAGSDGASPGGGLRTTAKVERKGIRGSLFRLNTTLRASGLDTIFNLSSTGIYYRFPAPSAAARSNGQFPLRISRVSLNTGRNARDVNKVHDSIDGTFGFSLSLPPVILPKFLLPTSATRAKTIKAKSYPLNINLTAEINRLGSAGTVSSPYPLTLPNAMFDSAKATGELLWSPGICQFRTRWAYTAYAKKDNVVDASVSAAIRFRYGRFSLKAASPDFPEKWNYTVSWRIEK